MKVPLKRVCGALSECLPIFLVIRLCCGRMPWLHVGNISGTKLSLSTICERRSWTYSPELCARQAPEALHLRIKVADLLA